MDEAGDYTAPSIGYRWIKANIYSALFTAVLGFLVYALARGLAVSDPETGVIARSVFIAAGSIITALGFAVYARLTAGVLSRKLPGFPVLTWCLLHILIGLALGALLSLSEISVGETVEQAGDESILGIALTTVMIGILAGGIFGSLQALVLRKAARNAKIWVGYSALGGVAFGVALLIAFYGPQSGVRNELVSEVVGAVVTVVIAIILLPAVRRLEPRNLNVVLAPDAPS